MATKNTTFKLTDEDLDLLDAISRSMRVSRTQALRIALRAYRSDSIDDDAGMDFLDGIRKRFDDRASLTVGLTDSFDAIALVDGVRADLYTPTLPVKLTDGQGYEFDAVRVYLGDPDGSYRLLLGVLPLYAALAVRIPLAELHPGIEPLPAYAEAHLLEF